MHGDRQGVSAFLAHVNEDDAGHFLCIGGFTRDAEDFDPVWERCKTTLIDLDRLVELWIEFGSISCPASAKTQWLVREPAIPRALYWDARRYTLALPMRSRFAASVGPTPSANRRLISPTSMLFGRPL